MSGGGIDAAIGRLIAAYESAGLPPVRPAVDPETALDRVKDVIAPLLLPDQVATFYRRVDPASVTVAPYPQPMPLLNALELWEQGRDEFPNQTPRLLFPIGYESWNHLLVELADQENTGGALLEWGFTDETFRVRFASLADYLDAMASMIEQGEFRHRAAESFTSIEFDPEGHWDDAVSHRLLDSPTIPGFGTIREIDSNPRFWPERWLASNGHSSLDLQLKGATTTIAALLDRLSDQPLAATIRGRVVGLGGGGDGCGAKVDDGTGTLRVWCPIRACTFGPVMREEFEFDVIVTAGVLPADGSEAPALDRLTPNDFAVARAAGEDLLEKAFLALPTAEASAVRPVV